ncbi:MAG: hypothetical protein ACI915_005372 [Gammaproteobacteria bacterium]|jgi:hypothetical protein
MKVFFIEIDGKLAINRIRATAARSHAIDPTVIRKKGKRKKGKKEKRKR